MVPAIFLATLVAFAIGWRRSTTPTEPVPQGVIQLLSVMPKADYEALEVKPELTPFSTGALIRIDGEFDTEAVGGPVKLILVQVRLQRRGKSVIMRTESTREIENGTRGNLVGLGIA